MTHDKSTQEGDHKPVHSGTTYAVLAKDHILMQSAIVRLKGNTAQLTVRAMFDTGSQRTFITKNLKEKLELKSTRKENINLTTFGSCNSVKKSLDVVTIHVLTDKQQIQLNALVTQTICPPFPVTIGRVQLPSELQGLHLADPLNSKNDLNVDILIGNDNFAKLITGNMKKSEDDCLIATESKMGWLISGPISKEFESDHTNAMLSLEIHQDEGEKLDEILTKFWEISSVPKPNKDNGNAVHAKFHKSIQFNKDSGRYTVKLPWRETAEDLPSNFALSKKRLVNLQCSLNKQDPELISKYDE